MDNLAKRLGMTTHISVLDHRLRSLFQEYPSTTALTLEDWLLDIANARGARIVQRDDPPELFVPPPKEKLTNEELIVAICMMQRLDRPQLLRLAAQLISRGHVNLETLIRLAKMERVEIVLGEMAKQALKVDSCHPCWKRLYESFTSRKELRSPIIHWQRLAWPVMTSKGYNAERWVLVK